MTEKRIKLGRYSYIEMTERGRALGSFEKPRWEKDCFWARPITGFDVANGDIVLSVGAKLVSEEMSRSNIGNAWFTIDFQPGVYQIKALSSGGRHSYNLVVVEVEALKDIDFEDVQALFPESFARAERALETLVAMRTDAALISKEIAAERAAFLHDQESEEIELAIDFDKPGESATVSLRSGFSDDSTLGDIVQQFVKEAWEEVDYQSRREEFILEQSTPSVISASSDELRFPVVGSDRDALLREVAGRVKLARLTLAKRADLEAGRTAAAEEAKARANENGLPELTGTERQIRWALQIRQKFIADGTVDARTREKVLKKTASAFWIDKYKHLTAR